MYLLGILFLHAATATLPVLPDPPTLPHSVPAAHQDSKIQRYIHNVATTSAPTKAKKDSEKVKKVVPTSMALPPPPQLPPYDYSILKKQKAEQKQKYKDFENQKAENAKKEKESVVTEKPLKIEVPANSETVSDSKAGFQDSKIPANIPIVTSDSAPVSAKKDNKTVKNVMVKYPSILIPSPPELPLFDYSILKKQLADQKQKFNANPNQQVQKSPKEKETVILEKSVQVEVPPKPATLIDSVTVPQDSEVHAIILSVTTDSSPVAQNNDDEELKHNKIKIARVVRPPPPQLPPFDYSNLGKQKSDQKPKFESTKPADEKLKEEKEAIILNVEKPVKVKVSLIPATWPSFVTAPQESDISANILGVATQAAKKPREEKETVNLHLENPVKVEETPIPATDSIAALSLSEVRMNTFNVPTNAPVVEKKHNEEVKMAIGKITLEVIPPPPELPFLDSAILQKHKHIYKNKSEQKQKSDDFLKQKAEQSKKDKKVFIIEKPVEVKVEEPKLIEESKLVGDSKPMVESNHVKESKPVEESKPKEELRKEPVKHSEDIPVIIKWTIPTAPFLSKLISNYPPLPSLGLNWPLQRTSKSRPPLIIYPKSDLNGMIHTN